jgi:predicted nucleic acid-binding protein
MIVVADTSPINHLVLIGEIGVLPKLYDRIPIPPSVCGELEHARAPEAVRLWINQSPEWLHVRASGLQPDSHLLEADIDAGERDAILLAQELTADETPHR